MKGRVIKDLREHDPTVPRRADDQCRTDTEWNGKPQKGLKQVRYRICLYLKNLSDCCIENRM